MHSVLAVNCTFRGGGEDSGLTGRLTSFFNASDVVLRGCEFTGTNNLGHFSRMITAAGTDHLLVEDCVFREYAECCRGLPIPNVPQTWGLLLVHAHKRQRDSEANTLPQQQS